MTWGAPPVTPDGLGLETVPPHLPTALDEGLGVVTQWSSLMVSHAHKDSNDNNNRCLMDIYRPGPVLCVHKLYLNPARSSKG